MNDSTGPSDQQPGNQQPGNQPPAGPPQQPPAQQPGQQPGQQWPQQPQQPPQQGQQWGQQQPGQYGAPQPQQGQWAQQPGPQQGPPPGQQQWGQQQYGQQQWGQQPPQQPPYGAPQPGQGPGGGGVNQGGGVNKKVLIGIVAVLVLLIGGVIAAVLLTGGDDDGDSDDDGGRSPVETVEALGQAAKDKDCEAAQELIIDGDQLPCEQLDPGDDYEMTNATEKSVDGDHAVVETEYREGEDTGTEEFHLTKVDGEWLVDLNGESSDEDSGGDSDEGSDGGGEQSIPSASAEPGTVTPAGPDPLSLVSMFTEAIKANDCDAAKELVVDPDAADCSEITTDDAESVEFGSPNLVTIDDDSATVTSDMTAGGSSVGTFTVEVVMTETGEWKIESWHY